MFEKNKFGELTTTQIVTLIILILSFVVIIIFISRLNLQEDSKREICKSSVILAGKDPLNKNVNCETSYVCITKGEKCQGISPDRTIKIDSKTLEKTQILKAVADELSDCWMMFGEGNVKYVQNSITGSYSYHCAVCSIIKFGDSFSSSSLIISNELTVYLESEKKDSTQTYASYLYRKTKISDISNGRMYPIPDINFNKKYAIITGINPEATGNQLLVYPSVVAVDDISSAKVCDVFDVSRG